MILVNLVRHKFVHIKYLKDSSLETAYNAESKGIVVVPPGRGAFRHGICVADQSIRQRNVPRGENVECFVLSFTNSNEGRTCCGRYPKAVMRADWPTLVLGLCVLAACRQLYQEGSHHHLASSTFSFEDSKSSKKFITSLTVLSKCI